MKIIFWSLTSFLLGAICSPLLAGTAFFDELFKAMVGAIVFIAIAVCLSRMGRGWTFRR